MIKYKTAEYLRERSDLENGYCRSHLRQALMEKYLICFSGVFLILTGIMLTTSLIFEGRGIDGAIALAIILVSIISFSLGVYIVRKCLRRKVVVHSGVFKIRGILREVSGKLKNPNTGHSRRITKYFIGDVMLRWPVESDFICLPYVGKCVEISVVLMEKSNPISFFGFKSVFNEDRFVGIVIEFDNVLNVHGVLSKYGRRYFLKHGARIYVLGFAIAAIWFYVIMYMIIAGIAVKIGFFPFILIALFLVAVIFFLSIAVEEGYKKIRKAIDPNYDTTTHSERLKG